MNKKLSHEKVFRDPIHDYIYVQDEIILKLIDTREFQRLRRIKQLGTLSFVFHGAEHNRFAHSLGCYEITRKIINNFENNNYSLWKESDRLVTLCAALLHDVGHGSYSHTFEHIFNTDHEDLTYRIIKDPKSEINKVLSTVEDSFPDKVASVINHSYPNPQVTQLISSQLDVDRMDYLLRDSYYTGTHYGEFDLNRILRIIQPYKNGITFQISGIHAVEDFIFSRFQMFIQIYFHTVSRSMETILEKILQRLTDLYRNNYNDSLFKDIPFLIPFLKQNFTLEDYIKLDDNVLNGYLAHLTQCTDLVLSDLTKRFLNRKPFESVTFASKTENLIPKLQKLIGETGFDINYYTATNTSTDLPYDTYNPYNKKSKNQIELIQPDNSIIELSDYSAIVKSMTGKIKINKQFLFPKELINDETLFKDQGNQFQKHIHNNQLI